MLAAALRSSTRKQSTVAAAAASAVTSSSPAFTFEWKGLDKPRTFTRPEFLAKPASPLYKEPELRLAPKKSKYKYDLNEFIELTKQVKRCKTPAELEALVKVTPYRIFNAFSIAQIYLKFHTFVPEARAVGTKQEEGAEDAAFVRPSVSCIQHMFLPAMDLELTPRAFVALTSAFVATHTPIPGFVLFKLRWAKTSAFQGKELANTLYNVAMNMPRKEPFEPMLSETKLFEAEIFQKVVNHLTAKMDANAIRAEYQNHALGEMAFALRTYYSAVRDESFAPASQQGALPDKVEALLAHFRAVSGSRSLNSLDPERLVNHLVLPLFDAKDAAFTQTIARQIATIGVSKFAAQDLAKLLPLFRKQEEYDALVLDMQAAMDARQAAAA